MPFEDEVDALPIASAIEGELYEKIDRLRKKLLGELADIYKQ